MKAVDKSSKGDLSNNSKRRMATKIAFIVGLLEAVSGIIGIVTVSIQAAKLGGSFNIAPYIIITIVISLLPLIAAFISRKRLRLAGIILLIIGAYHVVSAIVTLHNLSGGALYMLFTFILPLGMIFAGILCLRAYNANGEEDRDKSTNEYKPVVEPAATKETNGIKTIVEFAATKETRGIIEAWALKSLFQKGNPAFSKVLDESQHTYCYSALSMSSTAFLTIDIVEERVHVAAWVEYDMIIRLLSFFIIPKRVPLGSNKIRQIAVRVAPRASVNKLLKMLNQSAI